MSRDPSEYWHWKRSGTRAPALLSVAAVCLLVGGCRAWQGIRPFGRAAAAPRIRAAAELPARQGTVDGARQTIYQFARFKEGRAIVAFHWGERRLLWKTPVAYPVTPVGLSGGVIVCTPSSATGETWGLAIGLDQDTGAIRWQRPIADVRKEGRAAYAFADGRVYQTIGDAVRCWRAATAERLWEAAASDLFGFYWPHPPVFVGHTLYTQTMGKETRLVAMDTRNGQVRWQHRYPWNIALAGGGSHEVGPVAATSRRILALVPAAPGEEALSSSYGAPPPVELTCRQAGDGKLLWRKRVPWTNERLVVWGEEVCILVSGDLVDAYSVQDGRRRWRWDELRGDLTQPWPPFRGVILITQLRDHVTSLIALDAASGAVAWRLRLPRVTRVHSVTPRADTGEILVIGENLAADRARLLIVSPPDRS